MANQADRTLDAIEVRVGGANDPEEASSLLRRLRRKVKRMMLAGSLAAGRKAGPATGALLAVHYGIPPEFGITAGDAAAAGMEAALTEGDGAPMDGPEAAADRILESVADFRDEFEKLVAGLNGVKATIVLIDDLDRCLDDTIVDVFEAIRLFLQVSSTAFVIAANRAIVQAAIERRFPALSDGDPALGKDYLEKIVQVEVTIPALSEPEAETYLNLLFAELRLGDEDMQAVRAEAARRRDDHQFSVAMNYGVAKEVVANVPDALARDFDIANRIAPTLSRGLRGNPRQLKRFLNTMLLRIATANRRQVTLDPAVLAKLMILETYYEKEFQQLFLWQIDQHGQPDQLALLEPIARGDAETPASVESDLMAWLDQNPISEWLSLDPALAGVPLGPYFFFSRDRLSPAGPSARLSAALQALLGQCQLLPVAQRRTAVQQAAQLVGEEYTMLFDALGEQATRKPTGPALDSLVELTEKVPASWSSLTNVLRDIPPASIPAKVPAMLLTAGSGVAEVEDLLDHWSKTSGGKVKAAVTAARGKV